MRFTAPLAALAFLLCPAPLGRAQAPTPAPPAAADAKSQVALRAVVANIAAAEADAAALRAKLEAASTDEEKAALGKELNALREKLDGMQTDFNSVAAGMDWRQLATHSEEKFDTAHELEQLLRPIVLELKDLTAKPRETENLRAAVNQQENREAAMTAAIQNLDAQIAASEDSAVKSRLLQLHAEWSRQREQIHNELSVAQFQLDKLLANQRTVIGTLRSLTASFFRSRGQNLLFALLTFVAVFVLARMARWYLLRWYPLRASIRRSLAVRLLDIIYYVLCIVGAAAAGLSVLYASGDWVLLGLALLSIVGVAWASKNVLPAFYEQAKMLLNLGPVREGERVVVRGIPWEVRTINVYTELENPAFGHARLRIPLQELMTMTSRPADSDAPWFPCEREDWVRLSDNTRGKVVALTPEWVQLVLLGGSRKTYPVGAFLQLNPENLSSNFRVRVRFGIDYRHQADATKKIPQILEHEVEKGLRELIGVDDLKNLSVDFCEAGASSLDYLVLADFSGAVAARMERLERTIQRLLVDSANRHGWTIPFQQVTIHQAT